MKKLFYVLIAGTLFAHHAMEYIEMESYSTAFKGEKIFHLHYDYYVEDSDNPIFDHWELTPGISYGITNYVMFDVHTHFARFGRGFIVDQNVTELSPFIEALAMALQVRFKKFMPLDIAFVFGYEIPFERSKKYLDGKEVYEGKIILSRDFGEHSNVTMNFTFSKDGEEFIKEWAFGIKTPLSSDPDGIAGGIEILGDYEGALFFLPGLYMPIEENIIFKAGIGAGNSKSTSLRANVTLMYRF